MRAAEVVFAITGAFAIGAATRAVWPSVGDVRMSSTVLYTLLGVWFALVLTVMSRRAPRIHPGYVALLLPILAAGHSGANWIGGVWRWYDLVVVGGLGVVLLAVLLPLKAS